jgi:VWFA-related protein
MSLHPNARGPRGARSIAAALVGVATVAGLFGQSASQDQSRPAFRTEANYVRVDVYATGRDGAPIGDLRRDEFQLLEDRVPQAIDQFSSVVIRAGGPATARPDPRTLEEGRQAVTDGRARVFILFLDAMHVDGAASKTIARPLVDALRRVIGPEDLVAIVSPQTPIRTITFTRQLATVEDVLSREWGLRDRTGFLDSTEQRYATCYPGVPVGQEKVARDLGIAQEMILRRREEQTFEALESLVTYLRDVREERKAVITVSNGWRVFRPNNAMTRQPGVEAPTGPRVVVDPRTGTFSTDPGLAGDRSSACDGDRFRLAQLDHTRRFREILDRANRANVSFYPVDPRGIVSFDDDILPVAGVGQNPQINPDEDRARRGERKTSLLTMAEATDGVAVVDTSSFAPALQRMTRDLSAYYLLGYYSTGKLDGRFHAITVRITRPGVQVRARRGFLAATAVSETAAATPVPDARTVAEAQAVTTALASLGTSAREPSMYLQTAVAASAGGARAVWAVLELPRAALAAEWGKGGDLDVLLIDGSGNTAGAGRARIAAGTASSRLTIAPRTLAPGTYDLRVRARSAATATASNESIRVAVPESPEGSGALLFRRGPASGNEEVATADPRFRRNETLRIVTPASASTTPGSARLLDRTGKALAIPVTVTTVDESDGSRWLAAQAALAALGAGDYLIEVSGTTGGSERRTLVPFRVIP